MSGAGVYPAQGVNRKLRSLQKRAHGKDAQTPFADSRARFAREERRQERSIAPARFGPAKRDGGVGGRRLDPVPWPRPAPRGGQPRLRPMHSVRADLHRQTRIRRDQQDKAATPANFRELPSFDCPVRRPKMAIDDHPTGGQSPRRGDGIGDTFRIRHENGRWETPDRSLAHPDARRALEEPGRGEQFAFGAPVRGRARGRKGVHGRLDSIAAA